MTIQAQRQSSGGYVAHNVRVNSTISTMRYSVWFSDNGELIDCEGFDALRRARPVSPRVRRVLATMYGWIVLAARQQA